MTGSGCGMDSDSQAAMDRLIEIMATLRGPEGCPWDREQTLDTLKPYLIEESYEVLDALDRGDLASLREELGDLLLQIVFQSQLCAEQGVFTFQDVANGISDKLIRRHPHVFGDVDAPDTQAVLKNWDAIKKQEKGEKHRSLIEGVPKALPALARAGEIQKRVSRVGFDWDDKAPVQQKVAEEWAELEAAIAEGDGDHIEEELGDLLFSIVNLSRFIGCDPEEALRRNMEKFSRRFQSVEQQVAESGREIADVPLDELDAYWNQAKASEARSS